MGLGDWNSPAPAAPTRFVKRLVVMLAIGGLALCALNKFGAPRASPPRSTVSFVTYHRTSFYILEKVLHEGCPEWPVKLDGASQRAYPIGDRFEQRGDLWCSVNPRFTGGVVAIAAPHESDESFRAVLSNGHTTWLSLADVLNLGPNTTGIPPERAGRK